VFETHLSSSSSPPHVEAINQKLENGFMKNMPKADPKEIKREKMRRKKKKSVCRSEFHNSTRCAMQILTTQIRV